MFESATLIKQGAEARVYAAPFLGRQTVIKHRFQKTYRHPVLDKKLTSRRVSQESRCLHKCRRSGVNTPVIYFVDVEAGNIYMEYIDGCTVRDYLLAERGKDEQELNLLAEKIGHALASMHAADVIHGDLTTSNLMLKTGSEALVVIDFGLSYIQTLAEDKAVDLYVLERAFASTHPNSEALFEAILQSYGKHYKGSKAVLHRLEDVRQRGRKRSMVG